MKYNPFKTQPTVHMTPTVTRNLLAYQAGENGYTLNLMKAAAGTKAPLHSHPHLQVVYVLSGRGVFRCGDDLQELTAGDTVQIDSGVPHTFDSISEDATWLEFFTPEREDYAPQEEAQ